MIFSTRWFNLAIFNNSSVFNNNILSVIDPKWNTIISIVRRITIKLIFIFQKGQSTIDKSRARGIIHIIHNLYVIIILINLPHIFLTIKKMINTAIIVKNVLSCSLVKALML